MLIRRTHRSSARSRLRNARFRSNVFFVSPSRPATKLSPGRSRGIPFSPRSRPTAFTIRIASRHPSASMLRLFASVTRGSADSRPKERLVPGVAKATRSRIAAMASSGCAIIIAGSPLSVCKIFRSGAAVRIPSRSSRIAGTLICGVGEVPTERLKVEEVRLASEAEIHRSELRETTDLSEDAGYRSELRLSIHRLDAERAALVDVSHTAFRGVEFDHQRVREVGMRSDDVGTEQGPTVPLLHRAIAIRPVSRRQVIVHRHVDIAHRDPVERLDERLVVIAESRERSPEHSRTFEGACMMDDFFLANRQAAEVLARYDG